MNEISLYNLSETSNPDIFRYVDHSGNWEYYYVKSRDVFLPAVNKIIRGGFPKGPAFYNYLLSVTKEESEKILEFAGEQGSRVHSAIRMLINGETLSMDTLLPNDLTGRPEKLTFDEWLCLLAFDAWCNVYKPQTISCEKTVAGKTYAGTIDWIGMIEVKGVKVKVLLDWKTSSGIYPDYKAQTAAYYAAENDKTITHTGVIRLGTKHKNGHLNNAGFEVKLWDKAETKTHYDAFLAAQVIHDLEAGPFVKNDTKIPTVIKANITKYTQAPKAKSKATGVKSRVKKQDDQRGVSTSSKKM